MQRGDRIDNGIYDRTSWWEPDSPMHLIRTVLNPLRLWYVESTLTRLGWNWRGKDALEVGCGGGLFCEEISRLGFRAVGVDPSIPSLREAAHHAAGSGMHISYVLGEGESLPFAGCRFDAVFCCDVLEHVGDLPAVVSEISRVLRPGGILFYDTINRTLKSKLLAIKICQQWALFSLLPPGLHDWEMFIRPDELRRLLERSRLRWQHHLGMRPSISLPALLRCLRKRARNELSYRELGEQVSMVGCRDLSLMYLGYAIRVE